MEFTLKTPRLDGSDSTLTRILTADPDPGVRGILDTACRLEGWEAIPATDGETALKRIRLFRPHVVVTELAMPDVDGLALLGRIRSEFADVPVMALAGAGGTRYRIGCLAAGADDYLAKPFDLEEVMLRLKGMLRRSSPAAEAPPPTLVVGDLELDEGSRHVTRGGTPVYLTDTEFRLLRYLMCNPRRVLSKTQILRHVWDHGYRGRDSVVELYISYLRRKLDHRSAPIIHTVRGVGYMLRPG
ncbi:response regulator transcription factor [Glycomyces sp. TRM65418]|uniref:response regulator transcription factor n=1 Tax=Glycomyces sp. TRM65418 TaxID=2867006 RepID=UPI001CE4C565|nr:response regulator transcription factor [Glycomyces sp. TRM65418]MCC3765914.1 response regulator transcription factor [Glycomyces sp. TRM65418]QZD55496.1 response regulator transcription factor [Glycomyces sp. TRM65418]